MAALSIGFAASLQAAPNTIPSVPQNRLLAQAVYQVLLGEIALRRGEPGLAFSAWKDLAEKSSDPYAVKRAIEIGLANQRFEHTLPLARQWQQIEPENPEANRILDSLLVVTQHFDELLPRLKETLNKGSREEQAAFFLQIHRSLTQAGQPESLQRLIDQLATTYPDLAEAQYARALSAEKLQARDEAMRAIREARRLKPAWALPWLIESQWLAERDIPGAIALLREYLRNPATQDLQNPANLESHQQLARLLIKANQFAEARSVFQQLAAAQPGKPEFRYATALLALQLNQAGQAEQDLKQVLALPGADLAGAHFYLGQIYEQSDQTPLAIDHFLQIGAGEHWPMAQLKLARLYQQRAQAGDIELAQTRLNSLLAQQPDHADALYEAGLVAERLGDVDGMETHLRRLLKLQPNNPLALNALGYSLADHQRKLPEAHALVSQALSMMPNDPFVLDSMGWVLFRQGKLAEARQYLETAFNNKTDPEIAAHLGEVLWQLQAPEQARAIWQKALQAQGTHRVLNETVQRLAPELLPHPQP